LGGAGAAGADPVLDVVVADDDTLVAGAAVFPADTDPGAIGFAAVLVAFEDALSVFVPGAGSTVFALAFVGAAPVLAFAGVATAGPGWGCESPAGFDGFFVVEFGSFLSAGSEGIIEATLSFSTSTNPKSVLTLNMFFS